MSWSQLHGGAQCHPKIVALEGLLGISELEARGIALGLWGWTIQWEPSGDLSKHPPASIARGLAWTGDPNALISALIEVRLLDREGDRLLLHDWMDYAKGWKEAVRSRKNRDKEARKKSRTRTHSVPYESGSNTPVSPSLSLSQISSEGGVGGAPPEPAVITLPCAGGKAFAVTQAQVDRWSELYPGVNVLSVIRTAVAWSEANPKKRKTAARAASWLATVWLARAQNEPPPLRQGGAAVAPSGPRPPQGRDFTGSAHEMPVQGVLRIAAPTAKYLARASDEPQTDGRA